MIPAQVEVEGKKIAISFPFCRPLVEEVKCMRGARWDPEEKLWRVTDCRRNWMQLESLQVDERGEFRVPAELRRYHAPDPVVIAPTRELMAHQVAMFRFALSRRRCIWAAEQGTGKTLAAIEVMEAVGGDWWYVAPLKVLPAIELELAKWKCHVTPRLLNYDILDRETEPRFRCISCGEESPERGTWARAKELAHECGGEVEDGRCAACGWYPGQRTEAQPRCRACGSEVARHASLWRPLPPGPPPRGVIFDESSRLKSGGSLRTEAAQRLADRIRDELDGYVIEMTGTPAPHDPCDVHSQVEIAAPGLFRESTRAHLERRCAIIEKEELPDGRHFGRIVGWKEDEVEYLHERLKPVMEVHLAKDCLTLPELTKERIRLPVSEEVERAARLAAQSSINAAQALNKLRQLSDGFQYGGVHICSDCGGDGSLVVPERDEPIECVACHGLGFVNQAEGVRRAPGPKDEQLRLDLAANEEVGRLVVYAGYHASVDRCVDIAQEEGWDVLRCDGRGWQWFMSNGRAEHWKQRELLAEMDLGTRTNILDKLVMVAHPASGGLGLNLTAARENIFFSNDFNAESRWQAEKRSHRKGQTRGVRIKDYCHLPTDEFVLTNLEQKRALQSVTLGEVLACL
jgi:hypothetical protein